MGRATRSAGKKVDIPQQPQPKEKRERKSVKDDKLDLLPQSKPTKKLKKSQSVDQIKKQPVKKEPVKQIDLKKVTVSGGTVPVDSHFGRANVSKVVEHNGHIYAATLNQTNIANNNNKFYILQIIESTPKEYHFFCRWGRVGVSGQISDMVTSNLDIAISQYQSKLKAKTKGGDYRLVEMNYAAQEQQEEAQQKNNNKKKIEQEPQIQSDLPEAVQNFVRLIFDMKMMNQQMKQIGYDAKKMPLGKLSKSSIQKGYEALKSLLEEVKGKKRIGQLQEYSNEFYSYIPHDFGFIKMQNFLLDSQKKIKQKLEMLQSLEDIQIYTKIIGEGKISSDMNEIDSNYLKLKTEITHIDKKSDLYAKLTKYVKNTHAASHNNYTLEVLDIFRLQKIEQNQRYKSEIANKQLLWHGSRLTNFVGILSQGLRIAPPQAPVTGYMFGKGVYFADMVTKSANYCCTSKSNNIGLMLLCQVALGEMNQKFAADYYASNLPPGKNSTKGVGRSAPSGGEYIEGAWAPSQQGVPTGVNYSSLLYNQFIAYDVAQIKSKFLFKMKFNYK